MDRGVGGASIIRTDTVVTAVGWKVPLHRGQSGASLFDRGAVWIADPAIKFSARSRECSFRAHRYSAPSDELGTERTNGVT